MQVEVLSGFDSAWTAHNKGAIASLRRDGRDWTFIAPELVVFADAPRVLLRHRATAASQLVAVDQPLIVHNAEGRRPVDAVVSHVVGRFRGGVQPANRGRADMFGLDAPLWTFLRDVGAGVDPRADTVDGQVRAIEVFPALGNLGLFRRFFDAGVLPKYNPARRKTFRLADWRAVCREAAAAFEALSIPGAVTWCADAAALPKPRKEDQDKLDAVLCVLNAEAWARGGLERCAVIGDVETGYIVVPVHGALATKLRMDAEAEGVPFETRA